MRVSNRRQARQRRASRRANAWILFGYIGVTISAASLKSWQTAGAQHIVGWLAKTNAIVWDTITLAATLGALALGVREMVLAYFMRKEYEEDLALLVQNQQVQAETVQQQAETVQQQAETVQQQAEMARQQAESARQQAESARQQAETVKELADAVQQLLEQNRLLLERLDRQSNGHSPESPD